MQVLFIYLFNYSVCVFFKYILNVPRETQLLDLFNVGLPCVVGTKRARKYFLLLLGAFLPHFSDCSKHLLTLVQHVDFVARSEEIRDLLTYREFVLVEGDHGSVLHSLGARRAPNHLLRISHANSSLRITHDDVRILCELKVESSPERDRKVINPGVSSFRQLLSRQGINC